MPDIFISYSSKDRAQAEQLIELLASAGLSVWIDKSGIDVATSWSGEIVDAIEECKAFVVLLSPSSIESLNVIKEVSLASEQKKKILPLDLEPVELPRDLKYHLAGIQRAPMTNIDAVIRALSKLGLEATGAPQPPKIVKETDGRKSLMILPFEDLSPTRDNDWFAEGIVSELISALSNVKSLRIADHQATKEFKHYHGQLTTYANEMRIQYFVQGDVRKFGDQIKISVRLLDIESGDYLWQDSMKGTMQDIFEIQENVAAKVVQGLKVHLASDEKKKLAERGTENAEAYELFLKANEYSKRMTKEGALLSIQLNSEAIELDPGYANAYANKAAGLAALYRTYQPDPALLEEGMHLITEALRLKPDLWFAYNPLSVLLTLQDKLEEAEKISKEYIRYAPEDFMSHFSLGFFYRGTGQHEKAAASFGEAQKLKPEDLNLLWHLALSYNSAKDEEQRVHWAKVAIPIYERHLKLFPDDENNRVNHAVLLHFADRDEEAREAARRLGNLRDGISLYNATCLQCDLGDHETAVKTFRKAIEAGFRNVPVLKGLLYDEEGGLIKLKGTPAYEEVRVLVEKLEAEQAGKANA